MNIWPWSRFDRDESLMETLIIENHGLRRDVKIAERSYEAMKFRAEVSEAENESLRAQLAAKIGMESAYNPDNQPPGVSDAARRPVFPTPPKVSRPKRVWK